MTVNIFKYTSLNKYVIGLNEMHFPESTGFRTFKTASNDSVRIKVPESRSHGSSGTDGRMEHCQETIEDTSRDPQIDEPSTTETTAAGSSAEQHADDTRKALRRTEVCNFDKNISLFHA